MTKVQNEALSSDPHPTSGPAEVQPASGAPTSPKPLFSGPLSPTKATPLIAAEHTRGDSAHVAVKREPYSPACPSHPEAAPQRDAPGCPVPEEGSGRPAPAATEGPCGRAENGLPGPGRAAAAAAPTGHHRLSRRRRGAAGSCSGLVSMVTPAGGQGRPWRRGVVCRDVMGGVGAGRDGGREREGTAALTLRSGGRGFPAGPGGRQGGAPGSLGPPQASLPAGRAAARPKARRHPAPAPR